jgi:hypothetical protein
MTISDEHGRHDDDGDVRLSGEASPALRDSAGAMVGGTNVGVTPTSIAWLSTSLLGEPSFVSQRDHRIDPHRAPRR